MDEILGSTMKEIQGATFAPDTRLQVLRPSQPNEILGQFSPEDQQTIQYRKQLLSSLAYFVGKDFKIPVDLNKPGEGWHWDFEKNRISIDPKDLVERPLEELRFIVSHEGGHRRISRMDTISLDEWRQPGFSFMMNAIEDPRVNSFVVESYPRFRTSMNQTYDSEMDFEKTAKEQGKIQLGTMPRFATAGFEYIKQWYRKSQGKDIQLSEDLPEDVAEIVQKTLASAEDSWLRYPSKEEADRSEDIIKKYSQVSYEINRDEIWPEFKTLVDKDIEDQQMQQAMQDMQGQKGEGQGNTPQQLQDTLTLEQQQELEQALENAMKNTQQGENSQAKSGVVDLDSLSPELKQKIKYYIDSLPDELKQELLERAQKAIEEYEEKINEELQGKLSSNPEKLKERKVDGKETQEQPASDTKETESDTISYNEQRQRFRDIVEAVTKRDETMYEKNRKEVLPIIDELENDLREIFIQRRANKWHGGFKSGKRIDIKRRIQEKAKGISAVESHAWQRRELPQEKDYAVSLLIDLSGSMRGQKIAETFKAAIVLAEALNKLSIKTEILGFNDQLYVYQEFGQPMSKEVRDHMGSMLGEVSTSSAAWNDDGWALTQASQRLSVQKEVGQKFLFVLSDGQPAESGAHPRSEYDLSSVIEKITDETDQKLIGLGIGYGTGHVEDYYPNSIADITISEMPEKLADVIRESIENYIQF